MQKTYSIEKPYSKEQIDRLRENFEILKKARYSKDVEEYTRKVLTRIKK